MLKCNEVVKLPVGNEVRWNCSLQYGDMCYFKKETSPGTRYFRNALEVLLIRTSANIHSDIHELHSSVLNANEMMFIIGEHNSRLSSTYSYHEHTIYTCMLDLGIIILFYRMCDLVLVSGFIRAELRSIGNWKHSIPYSPWACSKRSCWSSTHSFRTI